MSLASPSVAATLPAVSEASEVASTPRMSPCTAICWPFLSTRKTIFELESTCSRWSVSLICWYSSSYITRSGDAMLCFHQFAATTRTKKCNTGGHGPRRWLPPATSAVTPACSAARSLNLAPSLQRLRHRDLIGVFEIAADRESEREPSG